MGDDCKRWTGKLVLSGNWPVWPAPLSVVLLALLAYVNSFPGIFVQDDLQIVVGNPVVREFDFSLPMLSRIFRVDYWGDAANSGLFRPLTTLTFALNHAIGGIAPAGYHLVNVGLHAGVSLLCWQVPRLWGFGMATAWLTAALFAVHPLHTEAVNVAVGRGELLAALFLLAAFWAARGSGVARGAVTVACFVLALLSKEHAIIFLAILPLWDLFARGDWRIWRERWPLYGSLLLASAGWWGWRGFAVIRAAAPDTFDRDFVPLAYLPWDERVLTALKLQWLYAGKLLAPINLQLSYVGESFPDVVSSPLSGEGLLLLATGAAIVALCIWGICRRQLLALCVITYLLAFLPTSNLLFPIGVGFAERLAYLPSVWFCAGLAICLIACGQRLGKQTVFWWGSLALVGVLGMLTVLRNQDYASELKLWQVEAATDGSDPVAWLMVGDLLRNAGDRAGSETAYLEMLRVRPDFAVGLGSLAFFYLVTDRPQLAIDAAMRSLAVRKGIEDRRAAQDRGLVAEGHFALGNYQEALSWLERGVVLDRSPWRYDEMRGLSLERLGRCAEAVAALRKVPLAAAGPEVTVSLGLCLLRLGQPMEAAAVLSDGSRRGIDAASLWNGLGSAYAMQRQWVRAVEAFERASRLAPDNPYYADNLRRARQEFERSLR